MVHVHSANTTILMTLRPGRTIIPILLHQPSTSCIILVAWISEPVVENVKNVVKWTTLGHGVGLMFAGCSNMSVACRALGLVICRSSTICRCSMLPAGEYMKGVQCGPGQDMITSSSAAMMMSLCAIEACVARCGRHYFTLA